MSSIANNSKIKDPIAKTQKTKVIQNFIRANMALLMKDTISHFDYGIGQTG